MNHWTWCYSVHCANGGTSHETSLDVGSGWGAGSQWWWKCQFWDTSSVVHQRLMGCFRLSSLDTLLNGGQPQVDQACACIPCPLRVYIAGAAAGTMLGRGVLFPESSLVLTACVLKWWWVEVLKMICAPSMSPFASSMSTDCLSADAKVF